MRKHHNRRFNVNISFNEFVSKMRKNLDFDFIIIYIYIFIYHVDDKIF